MESPRGVAPEAWWAERLSRLGVRGPAARDLLLAVAVTVLMVGVALATMTAAAAELPGARAVLPWIVLVVAVQSLALALRRVRLDACLALVVGTQVAIVALAPDVSVRTVAALVAGATIGLNLPTGRALRVAGAVALAEAAGTTVAITARGAGGDAVLQHGASSLLIWGAAVLIGTYLATRRDHLRLVQERAAQLERERDARVRSAVAEERARLARELHDVAAHHLSGMVVQAAAVERLVGRDPDAARAGAAWLRDQGRETLDSLRQVVGLLRGDDQQDGTAPVPGVAALPDLVRGARDLGDTVELAEVGAPQALPPLADVSVYRVAQQALTNARQHAPGAPVRVHVEHARDAVVLDVVNGAPLSAVRPAPGEHGGAGLAVMRERAALVGGTLDTGPTDDGGWRVRLRVPVDGAAWHDDGTVGEPVGDDGTVGA
ncbi:MAG: sensor histidine kinase [Cellulomonas sp.]|uniref:sensor histidine kinase n=1 Tax=Cellulomonas sp. TaxID=40001 RepID=UPI001A0F2E4A|nr:histidine kinase [Cellulomonas sp.]MBF0687385.1 sensor histidine kinase [Cellulomonas sp.]